MFEHPAEVSRERSVIDTDADTIDPYAEAFAAKRLRTRIATVINRVPKPVPVARADGTVLLRGRRRTDRTKEAADRRSGERRASAAPIG